MMLGKFNYRTVLRHLLCLQLLSAVQFTMLRTLGAVQQQSQVDAAPPVPSDVLALSKSIAGFTRDLYDKLSKKNPNDNLFFSPFSIATALGMTYMGARGNTSSQIAGAMKLEPNDPSLHQTFNKLLNSLTSENAQYTLSTANNLFADKKFKILEEYLSVLKSAFKSEATYVNFASDSEGARSTINTWVDKETNSKIPELIPSGVLSSDTALVLVNAIYFKGNWQRKFKAAHTTQKPFQLNNYTSIQVDMMYQKGKFPIGYIKELDCQILELPYVQIDLSMFILLPRHPNGLVHLEESLTPGILQSVRSVVTPKKVWVHLPKFKMEQGAELSHTLKQLEIKDLFSARQADLSGIDGTRDLYVSNVMHKAFIEVNEEGTEAAAATGLVIRLTSLYTRPQQFNADHPFLFFILHNRTGAILFIGRLSHPEASSKDKDGL